MNKTSRIACLLLVAAIGLGPLAASAAGQTRPGPGEGQIETDPIRCWWRADRTAVRVGERFGLLLTCAVIEVGPITVVPALGQLEPGALSITPFEVVSGSRGDDVVSPPWRYVQFEYVVRLLSDGFFGQDLTIPSVTVTYNLQTAGGTQGRDQTYLLPALPMRILSLVSGSASDIRDASGQTFAGIAARRFRSSLAMVLAWTFFAFAGVLAAWAVVGAVRHFRVRRAETVRVIPAPSILSGCLRALAEVGREANAEGWSPSLSRRAAAALRVAAAVALGRPVTQDLAGDNGAVREGQITMRSGWLRPRRVRLSSSVTAKTIGAHLVNGHQLRETARGRLEAIASALDVLTVSSYGRSGAIDVEAATQAVESSVGAIRGLRTSARWPMRTAEVLRSFVGF